MMSFPRVQQNTTSITIRLFRVSKPHRVASQYIKGFCDTCLFVEWALWSASNFFPGLFAEWCRKQKYSLQQLRHQFLGNIAAGCGNVSLLLSWEKFRCSATGKSLFFALSLSLSGVCGPCCLRSFGHSLSQDACCAWWHNLSGLAYRWTFCDWRWVVSSVWTETQLFF